MPRRLRNTVVAAEDMVEAAVDTLAEAEAAHAVAVGFREAAASVAASADSAAAMEVVSGAAMEAAVTMAAVGTAGRVFT